MIGGRSSFEHPSRQHTSGSAFLLQVDIGTFEIGDWSQQSIQAVSTPELDMDQFLLTQIGGLPKAS